MGKSRSATIVIAYLMRFKNMRFEEAYKFVRGQRSMVFPNLGFIRQLREYEKLIPREESDNN
jgi:protein-tyrosine phosphatase